MADEELLDEQSDESEEEQGEAAEPSLQDKLKEVIDVKVDDVGPLRKKVTVTIPHDKIAEQLDDQYTELRKDAAVPGFRKGRAPRRLLEKRFGNEIGETLTQQLVTSGYMAAVEKSDLKVIGDPLMWAKEKGAETETLMDVQKAMETIELPGSDTPLTFACEVEVRPEFELPETEGIPLLKPVITITDKEVDAQLDRVRRMRGTYENQEGPVQPDDTVMADIKMSSGGTVLKEETEVRLAARPQQLEGVTLEKLGEVLTGAKACDVRTISGQLPDDYEKAELRGKQADFEIKVREIQRLKLPEINEEFVKSLGFESEQDLRDFVRKDLDSHLGEEVKRHLAGQVYQYLLDNTKFELPGRLSERQAGRILLRRMLDLYRQGIPQAEVEKHLDQLRTGAQEETVRDLKLFFIMEKIAEKVEVDVSEGELNSQIAAIAQRQNRRFDRVRDDLAKEGGLMSLYLQVRDEKIVDQLVSKAKITETRPEDKPAEAKAESKPKAKPAKAEKAEDKPANAEESQEGDEPKKKSRAKRTPPKKGESDAT